MSKVEAIERAIDELTSDELSEFSAWWEERESAIWDKKFEAAVKDGVFDARAKEAIAEFDAGRCIDL